jgi:hypothetical protein
MVARRAIGAAFLLGLSTERRVQAKQPTMNSTEKVTSQGNGMGKLLPIS